jgi:glycosyltransferase involved in cell wall biosynthesis
LLYFTVTGVRAGVEEHILTLLKGLDRKYFRLHLACPPELADVLQRDLPSDVAVFRVSPFVDGWVRGGIRLAKYLRQNRIAILHSHIFRSSLFASPIGFLCRVPVIVETSHGREAWRRRGWKSSFLPDRMVNRCVDSIIAVSEANARFLVETKKLPARKVVVIRNGCDLNHFDPDHRAPAGLRESLGIGEGDPVLLTLGRLEPQKGHKVLIQAMPRVVAEFPKVRLICVGEGSLRSDLEAQTREMRLEAHVQFVGFQSNVADWLALADISVLPSFHEGLPLVAIESLAAGRPMVASAVDGTPEVVVNGQTGYTFPAGDSLQMANAICRLLGDADRRRRMAAAGRARVLEHFNQEQQIRKTQDLYLQLWKTWAAVHQAQALRQMPEGGTESSGRPGLAKTNS